MTLTTSSSSHERSLRLSSSREDSPPLAARPIPFAPSSSSTRSASKTSDSHRPKTAPSSQSKSPSSTYHGSSAEPPIPKIAIFADALSLKKLREQYQTIRKSPTLPDLSHSSASSSIGESKRPQSRRVQSATAATNNNTNNVTGQPQLSPQLLPELNFDSRASSASSSFARRAPASRSSNGVDTGKGPPPAIVTRSSSYTSPSDAARRAQNPAAATLALQREKSYNGLKSPTSDAFRHSSSNPTNPFEGVRHGSSSGDNPFSPFSPTLISGSFEQSLDAIMDRESTYSDAQEYLEVAGHNASGAATEGSGRSTEDLFLNLAQDTPVPTRSSGDLERRLVCLRLLGHASGSMETNKTWQSSRGRSSAQRTTLPPSSFSKSRRDSIGSIDSGARSNIPTGERSYSAQRRASTTSTPPLAASALRNSSSGPSENRFNMYRNRYMASSTTPSQRRPSVAGDSASVYSRPATYRPSKLNQLRDFDSISMVESPLDHRAFALRSEHHDIPESVVSGAQSTVWDELQELKSRIQQIELHDKIISTGSNGSNERPKTATTATTPLTTMSSSPKYQFKSGRSPQDSVIGGHAAVNAYPVLHQTLARCKDALSPAVYRALELATSDALELALLTGNGSAGGNGAASVANGGFAGERQLKRKADNVVRNLQDLCVEMCKSSPIERERPDTSSSRPGTSSGLPLGNHPPISAASNRNSMVRAASRASSAEPSMAATSDTTRAVPSRALDRIEARRASMMGSATPSATNSPREASESFNRNSLQLPHSVETTPIQQKVSQLPRSGTSLLRSRRAQTEEPEEDLSPRPVSRAATEIGVLRKRQNRLSGSYALNRTSREYTSNVPLPGSSPVASTPPTSTSLRRLNGTSLKNESPRSASLASSLLREPRRAMTEKERTPEPETPSTPNADEEGGSRRLIRRSLGLYTSNARASLGLGKRSDRRSVAAAGGGGE